MGPQAERRDGEGSAHLFQPIRLSIEEDDIGRDREKNVYESNHCGGLECERFASQFHLWGTRVTSSVLVLRTRVASFAPDGRASPAADSSPLRK